MQQQLAGYLVSQRVWDEAIRTWPQRPKTGWDDRGWAACCATHVRFVARDLGESIAPVGQDLEVQDEQD